MVELLRAVSVPDSWNCGWLVWFTGMPKWTEALICAISCTFAAITTQNVSHYFSENELYQVLLQISWTSPAQPFTQISLRQLGWKCAAWHQVKCMWLFTLLFFSVEVIISGKKHWYEQCSDSTLFIYLFIFVRSPNLGSHFWLFLLRRFPYTLQNF